MARLRDKIQLKNIPIDQIEIPNVPLDQDLLTSLVETDQKDPIKVVPNGKTYRVNSGKRRVRALKATGAKSVLALVVYDMEDDQEFALQALISNAGKPNPMDEADHMMTLKEAGYTQKQIAKEIGYSEGRVSYTLKFKTHLCPILQEMLRIGEINLMTATEATKLPIEEQIDYIGNLADAEEKVTYKSMFEEVRQYQAQTMPELPINEEIKPGLFLTGEQVEWMLSGHIVEMKWEGWDRGKIRVRIDKLFGE